MAGTSPAGGKTSCWYVKLEGGDDDITLVRVKLVESGQPIVILPKHLGNWFNIFIFNSRGVPEQEDRKDCSAIWRKEDRKDCSAIWRNEQGEITHIQIAQNRPFEGQAVTPNTRLYHMITDGRSGS